MYNGSCKLGVAVADPVKRRRYHVYCSKEYNFSGCLWHEIYI